MKSRGTKFQLVDVRSKRIEITYLRSVWLNGFFGLRHRAKALTDEIEWRCL